MKIKIGAKGVSTRMKPLKCLFGVPTGKFFGFIISRKGIDLDLGKAKEIHDMEPPKTVKN